MVILLLCATTFVVAALFAYLFNVRNLESFFGAIERIKNSGSVFVALFQVDEEPRNHDGLLVADVLKVYMYKATTKVTEPRGALGPGFSLPVLIQREPLAPG